MTQISMLLIFLLSTQAYSSDKYLLKSGHDARHDPIANDIQYQFYDLKMQKTERDYSTTDLNSLVDQIANEFNLDRNRVQDYFNRCRWSSLAKQLFNKIDFDQEAVGKRVVCLGGTVIKITKADGVFYVNCRKAYVSSKLIHIAYMAWSNKLGLPLSYFVAEASRPLSASTITEIYNALSLKIEGDLNVYKNI
ncbi:hypothetical protein TVAG_378860 [Trichomonas vaginalis G3]|uniref:DUF4468 domain-containing protein n=1 Tax=Trichomonas vaginalis (strain ATCC PRA-98 / G3) TaxID=412133 RepID=A2DB77_TRIV3|nr:hypothetical protein TVAGG3_0509100 [Trichomonas vaginalis G3]EAY22407.1 hypothetical protein TVAG_378860 [Trichomonas vaginalis G3]KAI5517649.1 hypothetical protein TVAGG3_0509100 [Trichomonas vaginalis G3]|eukprot:XP_001583393.1 hypothetical protein [Trichomonas vaginalis G3]